MHKHVAPTRPLVRRVGFAALAIVPLVALVVACAATQPAPVTPAPEPPAVPSEPSGGDTPAAGPSGSPVGFTCAEAIPSGTVGSWAVDSAAFTPAEGSDAAQAVAFGGIACRYLDSAGDTLVVGIAQPSADSVASLKSDAAETGTASSDLGGQAAYFSDGVAQVFAATYWISAESSTFTADSDAARVTQQIIQVLPAG